MNHSIQISDVKPLHHRVKGMNSLNWCSTWIEATFQMNVSKLPLWVYGYGAMLCFPQKAIVKWRVPKINRCETWWDLSFIQFPDCKVIALGFYYFPFSLHSLSPEWIYVVPHSPHITMFVKIMNSTKIWISNTVNELWKYVLKYFLILLTHPTGSALPPLKSLTVARKRSKRSAKQRLEYWKGHCGMATLIHTTY